MEQIRPVFLIGPPRTGTTLLARLLAAARGVLSLSEPFHLHTLLNPWVLRGFFRHFERKHGLQPGALPLHCPEKGFFRYLKSLAGANGMRYLVVKEVFKQPELPTPFPNYEQLNRLLDTGAPAVGIIRHPCDAAASTLGLLRWLLSKHRGCFIRWFWPTTPRFRDDDEIIRWAAINWTCFAEWTRRRGLFTIRYEDLVADPVNVLPSICQRVGIPFHADMLDHHNHKPVAFGGIGDPKVLMQKDRPVYDHAVGRGHNLTPRQFEIVHAHCGSHASEFGYPLHQSRQGALPRRVASA
jgi:hypothetical protein